MTWGDKSLVFGGHRTRESEMRRHSQRQFMAELRHLGC